MPKASAWRAFPSWRDLWASLDGVPPVLTEADASLRRRMAGNQRMPRWTISNGGEMLRLGSARCGRGRRVSRLRIRPRSCPAIVRRIHAIMLPALYASAWPRWLLLERAFLDGSATGDLLFAALALRTMCEEVQRLHAIDLDADRLACLAASSVTAISGAPEVVSFSCLDRARPPPAGHGLAWRELADLEADGNGDAPAREGSAKCSTATSIQTTAAR